MGWVKFNVRTTKDIFNEIIKNRPKWDGRLHGSSTPYEYWVDWLRDYYDVTLAQCDEICKMLKKHYAIKHFYYGE